MPSYEVGLALLHALGYLKDGNEYEDMEITFRKEWDAKLGSNRDFFATTWEIYKRHSWWRRDRGTYCPRTIDFAERVNNLLRFEQNGPFSRWSRLMDNAHNSLVQLVEEAEKFNEKLPDIHLKEVSKLYLLK